jgi:hypothetical protein
VALFSRKKNASVNAASTNDSDLFIGRKFRSSLSMDECIDNFMIVKEQCYRTAGSLKEIEWHVPSDIGSFKSSQGQVPTAAPVRVVVNDLVGGGQIYLAVWNGVVSYGDGTGSGGPPCEMWFVPSGFDMAPIQIAGAWKMRDASLSSIGWVEAPLWGA